MSSGIDKLLGALTSTKGALLAAPVVIGAGLLMAIGGNAQTKPPATAQAVSGAPSQVVTIASKPKQEESSSFSPEQEKAIGAIVRKYLLANPEVLIEVSHELEKRQNAEKAEQHLKLISSQKDEIFHSPIDFVIGNKDAKITVVEYFDYNCGWCKRAVKEVSALIKQEPNIRVVMKEFPIFGEHSEYAAKAAMASKKQGKYWEFHLAMMHQKRVTKDNVMKIAASVGIDVEKLKQEMANPIYDKALHRNLAIAQTLGIQGTPGFIIDSEINPGYMPVAVMKQKIAEIREKGCRIC